MAMQSEGKQPRPWLRCAVVAAGIAGTLFWIGSLVSWWRIPDSHRDGLELMGPVIATGFFVVLVLPTLVLGAIGRWLPLATLLGALVLMIVSDDLAPWVPWDLLPRP
jgi:hypothetical protein